MLHSIQRLRGVRMAVVLAERRQLAWGHAVPLIDELQLRFQLPVMLVAKEDSQWLNAKSAAHFDSVPYLFELLARFEEIEWLELPEPAEPELPF